MYGANIAIKIKVAMTSNPMMNRGLVARKLNRSDCLFEKKLILHTRMGMVLVELNSWVDFCVDYVGKKINHQIRT